MFWSKALTVGLAAAVLAAFGGGAAVVGYRQAVAAEDKKADKDKLQGEWALVTAKMNGKDATEHERTVIGKVVFDGDKLTVRHDCDYKLDPTKKPKHIDVTPRDVPEEHKGKSFLGIYALDGDEMKLHLAMPGGKRPTDFESKDDGSDRMLLVLKRVKK